MVVVGIGAPVVTASADALGQEKSQAGSRAERSEGGGKGPFPLPWGGKYFPLEIF